MYVLERTWHARLVESVDLFVAIIIVQERAATHDPRALQTGIPRDIIVTIKCQTLVIYS